MMRLTRPSLMIAILLWMVGLSNLTVCVASLVLSNKVEHRNDLTRKGLAIEQHCKLIFESFEQLDSLLANFVQNDDEAVLSSGYIRVEQTTIRELSLLSKACLSMNEPLANKLKKATNDILELNRSIASEKKAQGGMRATMMFFSSKHRKLTADAWSAYKAAQQETLTYATNYNNLLGSSVSKLRWLDVLALLINAFLIGLVWWLYRASSERRREIQERLVKAKEVAERAIVLKEQFMANMSHEIRTPLNGILGFSRRLERTTLDPMQLEALKSIQFSGEQLLAIVNDILDYSRLEAGMMQLESVSFSLFELLQSLQLLFALKAQDKRLVFRMQIDQDVPNLIVGDPNKLSQILSNLLSNAVKFTKRGYIDMHVSVLAANEGGTQLSFKIADTGIGIHESKLDTIFDRFVQAEDSTTRLYGGTGLGLSIAKEAILLMGGKITVDSVLGEGTSFTVSLPFILSDVVAPNEGAFVFSHEKRAALASKHILVVEDNAMNATLAGAILTDWGVRFDLAENGVIALEMLKIIQYDLILMDIQMPDMGGTEATTQIRTQLRQMLPIIAMSANDTVEERKRCLSYGMNDYLPKPFIEKDLLHMLLFYLNIDNEQADEVLEAALPPKDNNPIQIDKERLLLMARGKPEFLVQMARIFLQQYPNELLQLDLAIQNKNWVEVNTVSHNMKTTTGYMGLQDELWPLLTEIEKCSQSSDPNIESVFQMLQSRSVLALDFVRREIVEPA